jgi:uncharacterized protein (DUF924 family)
MDHDLSSIRPGASAALCAPLKNTEPDSRVQACAVVDFWRAAGPKAWFSKNPDFDRQFRQHFYDLHFSAARRECEHWLDDAYSCLALILLLDQFPRNAFRGTAHRYATDPLARRYARAAVQSGHLERIEDALRLFVVIPFIHSENLDDQRYGVQLYCRHAPGGIESAVEHCAIVQRFGRFPHRNLELGRSTTPEEQQFLDEGGFSG